ncbi:MAG: NAD(P)/FAD-dependent oxidoreductase [Desulfobacteraceae bacterium]|nr:NAD(P)/FAD-dependent oxidoreductase [Desulfobacteraceae bacterium]MDH3575970.1 NAD(P)/FAD-dependent oxidoreductase [Desulfobacteraceae bacterium]MDH3839038.1 NAD(P)/FAD-dependent oxidoreductase [Desulfobacteraceae bacterium]MDH3875921.1 NAD(P)/FAD-dependent oxidoreductase [Desulfobacteraceae bacterium]
MRVLILGSGFAGLNAAKVFGGVKGLEVIIIDQKNYHLFQPLLYQVAAAALSPAEIAVPIRNIFSRHHNIKVFQGKVHTINADTKSVFTNVGEFKYNYLIVACGARHYYFGNEAWEENAPGLKTIEQAVEIRRRVLTAFENAETENDIDKQIKLLTFIIVGGGSTGVELAGALAELSRFTFAKDFRNIDTKRTRILLIEAGPRILPNFSEKLSLRANHHLEKLGVQVLTFKKVTKIDADGVNVGDERIEAATVLWAAGIKASGLNQQLRGELDSMGRIVVEPDLSLKHYPEIFVAGDQAHFSHQTGKPLHGIAPVALQQGRFIAKNILKELEGKPRETFHYIDKGQLATIGRNKAVLEIGRLKLGGFLAWMVWLFIHIYYLIGFKNKFVVLFQWASSYLTYQKGARLIVDHDWRFYEKR